MKRLMLFLLLALTAFGQTSITPTSAGGQLTNIEWNWTSDGSGNATGQTSVVVPGAIYAIETSPDTTAVPTDNYDVTVQNVFTSFAGTDVVLSTDRVGGTLANRDSVNSELVEYWPDSVRTVQGKVRINISNAGSAKSGRIVITVHRNLSIEGFSGAVTTPPGDTLNDFLQWVTPGSPAWVAMNGDATLGADGLITVANGAITPAKTSITGTPTGSKFLRDDWSWQSPGGGGVGDVVGPASSTNTAIALFDGTTGKLLKNSNITYTGSALLVPADIAITGGNGLAQQSGTQEWYSSAGVGAGNLRYRWVFDTDTEASTYTGSVLQLLAYDNTGDGSAHTAWTLARDPASAWVFYHPITVDKLLLTKLSATTGAGFRLPPGAAPTSPVDGDVWTTTAGLYARINGATVGPYIDSAGAGVTDHGALTGLADDDHPQYGALAQAETIAGDWVNTANPWANNEVADDITISTTSNLSAVANNTFGNASTDTHTFTGIAGFYGATPDSDWAFKAANSINIYKGTAYDYTASTTDLLITNSAANSRFIVGQDLTNYSTYTWTYNATAGSASSRLSNNANQTMYIGKDASSPISFPGTTDHDGAANFDAGVTIGDAVADTMHINPSSITLEGDAADANEITITTAALGADYTQTLPAKSGTFAMTSDITGPSSLSVNYTAVENVLGGEDNLQTYTVPAATLANTGDRLVVLTQYEVDTGGANTIKLYWDGVAIYNSGSVTPSETGVALEVTIVRTGAASQLIYIRVITGSTTHTNRVIYTTGAATLSGTVVIKGTGQDAGGTSGDVSQQYMEVVKYPAP